MSTFKTLNRKVYDDARARVLPTAQKENQQYANHEVLMYDEDGNASETSLCSVYFWRHGQWVTPPVANLAGLAAGIGYDASGDDQGLELKGGQRGTTRRYALERKLCVEEVVPKDELRRGEVCWISNGVRGFAMAVLGQGGGLGTSSKR